MRKRRLQDDKNSLAICVEGITGIGEAWACHINTQKKSGVGIMHKELVAPVEVGKIYPVVIGAVNPRGEGIGHFENFVVFVRGAKAGEKLRARVTEIKRTYAVAQKI